MDEYVGGPRFCRSCQAPLWWTLTKNGKLMPMDVDPATGEKLDTTHYITCPQSQAWRKHRAGGHR